MTLVPASSSQSIQITTSIFSGIVLFAIFWDENITIRRVALALVCVVGVTLVIQPEFIFVKWKIQKENSDNLTTDTILNFSNGTAEENDYGNSRFALVSIGHLLPMVTGFAVTVSLLILKRCYYLRDNMSTLMFWTFVNGTLLSAVFMMIFEITVMP